eukprot:TRINITY_DN2555_c0_g2_i1.p1 TRINITY_DN2555_c0_g2~~TRINITY_DN2555_c0_g2_i1.p1  ORF type:complete len:388 (+),score=78.96 TRINITY_DN2555_c0_g2_i1:58-1221(+)
MVNEDIDKLFSFKIEEEKGKSIEYFVSNNRRILDCKYSPNGEYFAVSSYKKIFIFDARTYELKHTLRNHLYWVFSVEFSSDGQFFASCSNDKSIIIYNGMDFSVINQFYCGSIILDICFSPCSNFLCFSDFEGYIYKFNMKTLCIEMFMKIHSNLIDNLLISPNGKYILSGSGDRTVKLIDFKDFSVIQTFNFHVNKRAIEFHPIEDTIVIGDSLGTVELWHIFETSLQHTFTLKNSINCLHYLNEFILFIASEDGYITSYNTHNYQQIQQVHCDFCEFFSFDFSSDQKQIFCGRSNYGIKIFPIGISCNFSSLIEMSRIKENILSTVINLNCDDSFIRNLVYEGICVSIDEFNLIFDRCWDLVEINKRKGGNIYTFVDTSNDDCDD